MAIIDVVVFFVQKAKQIMELIDAFLDSILAVASGSIGAVAVYKASGKALDYITEAWNNNPKNAGKALATAFAIIVAEFFIDKILLGMGKVMKGIVKGIKATKVGKTLAKASTKVSKVGSKGKKTITNITTSIKNNKIVVHLKDKIVLKGVKKFQDLRQRILSKFGFKKVWAEKHGKRMQIWGEFNAKVLLMETDVDGNKTDKIEDITDASTIGSIYSKNGKNGIVLDSSGNNFSRHADDLVKKNDQKTLGEVYNDLDKLDDIQRANKIRGGAKSERVSLRKEVEDEIWKNAETGKKEIINGKKCKIYKDGKTGLDIPNYGTHYPDKTPLGHPHPKAGQTVPDNLIGKPRADVGHKSGQTWAERLEMHKEAGSSREQIIEAENKSDLYVIEERSSNRSRKLD